MRISIQYIFMAISLFSSALGCSVISEPTYLGENATFTPGWKRVGAAIKGATVHPGTWVPLAGAVIFQGAQWDKPVSDWAVEHAPLFGSNQNAADWSDALLSGSRYIDYLSIVAVPAPRSDWFTVKGKVGLIHLVAGSVTHETTSVFKEEVGRTRPNGANRRSFPSGHTSMSTVHYLLTADTLNYSSLPPASKQLIGSTLVAMGGLTGWARVEANVHYPSDVMAGYALGNWFAHFTALALLSADSPVTPLIARQADGTVVGFSLTY